MTPESGEVLELHTRTFYSTEDLDVFKAVLQEALTELGASDSPLLTGDQAEVTKVRLAASIFMFADGGERDPDRLKELAIEAVHSSRTPIQVSKVRAVNS